MAHFDIKKAEKVVVSAMPRFDSFSFFLELCKTDSCISASHSFGFQETSMLRE